MKKYRIVFLREASDDLNDLHAYLTAKAGIDIASAYIAGIKTSSLSLSKHPVRGRKRDDVLPGLRVAHYKKRVNILFFVKADDVIIHGIFYDGRDIRKRFTRSKT